MRKFFLELPKHVKHMSADQLRAYFPEGTNKSLLMRSIIMNEKQYSEIDYKRSLRSLWYSTVKPTLDKLGLLTDDDQTEEGLTKWDAVLSRYVADLLKRGYITYRDLSIVDNSRQRANPLNYYDVEDVTIYGNQVNIAPYSNIIIATEKDTVYNIIKDIAKLFGTSCISSKGQNSLGAMEDLVRGMHGNYDEIYILTMTDYDPAGYYIADALYKQVKDILTSLGNYHTEVYIERIGITPDQLSEEMVQANKYTPKPANLEKWFEKTGGIDGKPKGLELDALTPDEIRDIFVTNIEPYIDKELYTSFIKKSYVKQVSLKALAPYLKNILDAIADTFEDEITIDEFDISDIAKQGYNSIPVSLLCDDDKDEDIEKFILNKLHLVS